MLFPPVKRSRLRWRVAVRPRVSWEGLNRTPKCHKGVLRPKQGGGKDDSLKGSLRSRASGKWFVSFIYLSDTFIGRAAAHGCPVREVFLLQLRAERVTLKFLIRGHRLFAFPTAGTNLPKKEEKKKKTHRLAALCAAEPARCNLLPLLTTAATVHCFTFKSN